MDGLHVMKEFPFALLWMIPVAYIAFNLFAWTVNTLGAGIVWVWRRLWEVIHG